MRAASTLLPTITIGTDMMMPIATSIMSPCAAAAIASTLSRLIVTSATRMSQIACQSERPCRPASGSPPSGWTSL